MPHEIGTRLGGLASAEDMRLRCHCDPATGCWHFRLASGKSYAKGQRQMVWLFGGRTTTPTRAMWEFSTGRPIPPGLIVYRRCDSHDCVNPGHLRCGPKVDEVRMNVKRGTFNTPAKQASARAAGMWRSKLTPELRVWIMESSQTGVEVARVLGMSQGRINCIRQKLRASLPTAAPSVFALGAAMNSTPMRRRA